MIQQFRFEKTSFRLNSIGCTKIKFNQKIIGYISEIKSGNYWEAKIAVRKNPTEGNDSTTFKWIVFENKFSTENKAREYLLKKQDKIIKQHKILGIEEIEHEEDNYFLVDESDIPECCGICYYARIENNKIKCLYGKQNNIFGLCDNFSFLMETYSLGE